MKHAQGTEKYIRLIFNSYISDDDFFSKVHAHYRHELVFSGDFQGQEGVRIMHQCALCNPKYGITFTKFKQNIYKIIFPLIHTFSVHINIQIAD